MPPSLKSHVGHNQSLANGTVGVLDASTGKLLQTVKAVQNPDAIVYEPTTHRVFALNGRSSDVTAIDAQSLKVLAAPIASPGTPEYAVVDGKGHVYFNVEDKSEPRRPPPPAPQGSAARTDCGHFPCARAEGGNAH